MDELLKLLFGARSAQAAEGPQAFPIVDQPVSVMDIPRISEYEADMRIAPPVEAQAQAPQSGMRFPSFSMPNFQMPNMPSLPMPNVPEYMSGLISDPAAAQQQAQRSGLLNAAIALLEAGGPQQQRTTLGQAAGRGLGAYQQGVQGSFDQILQGMLMKQKLSPQETEAVRTLRALRDDPSLMATQLAKSAAGAPKIQNIVGTAETEFAKVVGKGVGEDKLKAFNLAKQSYDNIPKIDETLSLLESGDATTGIGAEVINNVNRLKTFFGSESAKRKVSDTEYLDALLGSDVFPQIGALGIGARGLDTPAEREFLRKVMTGTVAMDKDTLIRLTKTRRNIQERAIKNFNKDVEEGNYDKFFEASQLPKRKFDIPKPRQALKGPPAGISPQEWNYMTPEEKALFQ
jgi:hypothetical protein